MHASPGRHMCAAPTQLTMVYAVCVRDQRGLLTCQQPCVRQPTLMRRPVLQEFARLLNSLNDDPQQQLQLIEKIKTKQRAFRILELQALSSAPLVCWQ